MTDPQEIASQLRVRKSEVEKLGFALKLFVVDQMEIDSMVHRINAWIDDAIERLNPEDSKDD